MSLMNYRQSIDQIDQKLLKNLQERFEVIAQVAQFKKENNLKSLQLKRWQQVLQSKKERGEKRGLKPEMIEEIWNIIHKYALKQEDEIISSK